MSLRYKYESISESGFIRVITLHPAARLHEPICCDLETTPLHIDSDYAALSYSWGMDKDGDVSLSRTIMISGTTLAITQNLFEGLCRIRDQAISRRLWIDAVCINQSNTLEQNAQVTQMGRIYSCATHVIVWLGEGASESQDEDILSLVTCSWKPNDQYDPHRDHLVLHNDSQPFRASDAFRCLRHIEAAKRWYDRDSTRQHDLVFMIFDHPGLVKQIFAVVATACRLLMRRYWQRRWIVQELHHTTPGNVELRWGPCVVRGLWHLNKTDTSLWEIVHCAEIISSYQEELIDAGIISDGLFEQVPRARLIQGALGHIHMLQLTKREPRSLKFGFTTLMQALDQFSFTGCADDRDRLYALLSLDPDHDIRRNYSMSAAQIFTLFAAAMVREGEFDSILMCLSHEELEHDVRLEGLPSWVPDLRSKELSFKGFRNIPPQPMISSERYVVCHVRVMGSVERIECDVHRTRLLTLDHNGHLHSHELENKRMQRACHKDLLCSLVFDKSVIGDSLLVLRDQSTTHDGRNVYQLIACGHEKIERDPSWPRIIVTIE